MTVRATVVEGPRIAATELGSAELQDLRGVAADDPVRAVQALPGVATGDDFQAEFSVRGSAFRHVGLVIDGTSTPLLFHTVRGTEDTGSIAMINTDVLGAGGAAVSDSHARRHGDWLGATLEFDVREGSRDRTVVRGRRQRHERVVRRRRPARQDQARIVAGLRPQELRGLAGAQDRPGHRQHHRLLRRHAKVAYDLTPAQQVQLHVIAGDALYRKPTATAANDMRQATSTSVLTSAAWRYAHPRFVVHQRLSFVDNDFIGSGQLRQVRAAGDAETFIWRAT